MSKKIIALALAFAFAFSFTAKAVTVEELQAQIQQLLALIQTLQSQQGQGGMYCFNTDLKYGMTSNDVKNLQIVLGVTPTSGYFGPKTLAAVKAYQASKGIVATGYVGPLTRTALNSQYCVPPTTTTTTVPPESTTTTTTVAPSYGSLSVTSYPVSNPVSTLYGGQTYEVLAGQFKATGSDITLKKVAVQFTASSAFPWQYFTTVSVWDGSTKLGEAAVTQSNLIEDSFATTYTLNIAGLNWVIPNGQQKVLTIKATVAPTIVTSKSFTFAFPAAQVVYTDTAGVTYTSVSGSVSSQTYTVSNAQPATITVTEAIDNPLEGNIIGSSNGTTRVDLLKFNVKVENVNATFNSGTITATSTTAAYLTAVELWDGSTLIASAAPANPGGAVSWTNFSLPISAGTTKTLTVKGVIAQLSSSYTGGDTVRISTGPVLTGIDANSNVATATGSSVTGNTMHLYLAAPSFSLSSTSFTSSGTQSNPKMYGDAKIVFAVTANTSDIYLNGDSGEYAVSVTVGGSTATTTNVTGFTCTSGATPSGSHFRVAAGATATCELTTSITLSSSTQNGFYQVQINFLKWATNTTNWVTQNYGWAYFKTGLTALAY